MTRVTVKGPVSGEAVSKGLSVGGNGIDNKEAASRASSPGYIRGKEEATCSTYITLYPPYSASYARNTFNGHIKVG